MSQANKALRSVAVANIMLRVSQVCATMTDVISSPRNGQACREEILNLIQEAEDIDEAFEQWYKEEVPPLWRFWAVEEPGNRWRQEISYPDSHLHPVHAYQNISLATTWNFVRTGRIILHQTVLEFARFLSTVDPLRDVAEFWIQSPLCAKSLRTVDDMIDDLLASVPFLIGEIDSDGRALPLFAGKVVGGIPLQWSLWVVKTCPFASTERVLLSRKALERMGSVMGFRKAYLLAHN
jgi:hypothetical protein